MSGFGERFRRAGYQMPKPLIEVDGKPIIEHVVNMFPGEEDFLFICNEDHLDETSYKMREVLNRICPTGSIVGIPSHKLGPVHAIQCVRDMVGDQEPVIVNYCDFTCFWDWSHFKAFVQRSKCDGAIPAYKGFHPHSLGTTNYAYMKENGLWLEDIQEKQPFTDDRMNEFASSGTYYFKTARQMLSAFDAIRQQQLRVGGEYYVSLAYKPMITDQMRIAVYPLQHFMQWGTPEDLEEYTQWSHAFARLSDSSSPSPAGEAGHMIMPMAGLGKRFSDAGYELPKPIIEVSGKPMFLQAAYDQPSRTGSVFVVRNDMPGVDLVVSTIQTHFPDAIVSRINRETEGQACTAKLGLDALHSGCPDLTGPITFAACDNGVIYDQRKFFELLRDPSTDIILWGTRGYANAARYPKMYGWIELEGNNVTNVSVKAPLENPKKDPIIIGTFTFKDPMLFDSVIGRLIAEDRRVNDEFYLDSCINIAIEAGLSCKYFEVEHCLNWGTPNDLKTFQYWQSCFHKWPYHPYRLESDRRVAADRLDSLEKTYRQISPPLPKA